MSLTLSLPCMTAVSSLLATSVHTCRKSTWFPQPCVNFGYLTNAPRPATGLTSLRVGSASVLDHVDVEVHGGPERSALRVLELACSSGLVDERHQAGRVGAEADRLTACDLDLLGHRTELCPRLRDGLTAHEARIDLHA